LDYLRRPLLFGKGTYRAAGPHRVIIKDAAAYGLILTQGYGTFGGTPVSTPSMIRFGELTEDELFVTAAAAKEGVHIKTQAPPIRLVILKHFGPGNPDAESLRNDR
jgi:hypothetical protein